MTQTATPTPVDLTVTDDADGGLHLSTGKLLTLAERNAVISFLADKDLLIALPGAAMVGIFLLVKAFLAAAQKGDRLTVVTLFGRMFTWVTDFIELANLPPIKKQGAPSKPGFIAAVHATVATLIGFPKETANTHASAPDLTQKGNYLNVAWALRTLLAAGTEKVDRNTIPLARVMVDTMRQVLVVVDPILDTHSDVALALNDALSYLKDPHRKAAKTRKDNQRRTAKTIADTKAAVLPEARDQARAEIRAQIGDKLTGVLGTNKG